MDQRRMVKDGVRPMDQREMFVAKLCAVAAMTASKSGRQLFLKGSKPLIEPEMVDDPETLAGLAAWLRERRTTLKDPIWFRAADVAATPDLVLFIGLAGWYRPVYDRGACGYATGTQFLTALSVQHQTGELDDREVPGPICQIRCIDPGIAVSPAATIASLTNVDAHARCQTRLAAAARHLRLIQADLAVSLAMSMSHKNVFFDRTMPQITVEGEPSAGQDLAQSRAREDLRGCGRGGAGDRVRQTKNSFQNRDCR